MSKYIAKKGEHGFSWTYEIEVMNSSRLIIVIAIAVALLTLLYQPVVANRIIPEAEVGLEEMYDLDDLEGPFFVDRRGFLTSSRLGRRKKGFLTAGRLGR
ncbi:unnamed protein product [Rodentolepis nana]|uniref:Uncharacterized protein n=1 Tax=Rodentolepis nana TaxID=102285 RepID=A0A0R3TS98_RODNA|nr:unnamed protein product [Rodentolepis nana]